MEKYGIKQNIKQFLFIFEFKENKSISTIKSTKKDLEQMEEYLEKIEKITNINEVTPIMLRGFITYLHSNEISRRSINRKLSSLRNFFKHLLVSNIIYRNPMDIISSLDFVNEKPTYLSANELENLRNVISLSKINGIRDRLIIELLYSTGIKSVELLGLGEGVFDLDRRELYIGKGKNKRIVFFSQNAKYYLKEYLQAKKEKYKNNYKKDILFVNGSGNRLSDRSLRRIIDRYAIKCGIEREISPHTFRHTFIFYMLLKGMDAIYVKELAGFNSIDSLQVYLNIISSENLKKIYLK